MTRKQTIILLIFLIVSAIVFFAISFISQAINPSKQVLTTPLTNPSNTIFTLDKTDPKIAQENKNLLLPKLPIEIKNFNTSVNIKTDIFISSVSNDSPESVRIEILGPDYQYNQNDPNTNPNMIAYQESFDKVKSLLQENGVEITNLKVVLSNKQYIREIAENWINTLHLLP